MSNTYSDLFEAIREKCRQQRWYGPDKRSPMYIQKLNGHGGGFYWHDDQGNSYQINLDTDMSQFSIPQKFIYPPATEEQLRETKRQLGFALHPCLCELYTQVANGGFGPGCGINGINGGYVNGGLGPMVERYVETKSYSKLVGPEIYAAHTGDDGSLEFSSDVKPDQWLEFCHWGCAIYSYLDNRTGCIYRLALSDKDDTTRYRREAPSIEAWFQRWIDGTLLFEEE